MFSRATHSCEKTDCGFCAISCHIFVILPVGEANWNASQKPSLGRCLWMHSTLFPKKQIIHEVWFLTYYLLILTLQLIKHTTLRHDTTAAICWSKTWNFVLNILEWTYSLRGDWIEYELVLSSRRFQGGCFLFLICLFLIHSRYVLFLPCLWKLARWKRNVW